MLGGVDCNSVISARTTDAKYQLSDVFQASEACGRKHRYCNRYKVDEDQQNVGEGRSVFDIGRHQFLCSLCFGGAMEALEARSGLRSFEWFCRF